MTGSERKELLNAYIERVIDNMDISTMAVIVGETLENNLSDYSDEQLIAEVADFYPDLLENGDE
jgi:hypothetical protein